MRGDYVKGVATNLSGSIGLSSSLLRGFVCTYYFAAPGSNPKHTIYAFFQFVLKL